MPLGLRRACDLPAPDSEAIRTIAGGPSEVSWVISGPPAAPRMRGHAAPVRSPGARAGSRAHRGRDHGAVGPRPGVRAPARAERGRPEVLLHRRPGHCQQGDGRSHRVGAHAQGRVPALSGAARPPPALPERVGLPGAVDRGRGGEVARPELQARDRGVRARALRCAAAARWSPGPRTNCAARRSGSGMWMDWERDYYTFSDTNIEYIWRFLARGARPRLAGFAGTAPPSGARAAARRSTQHELSQAGVHQQREDSSLYVRLPFLERPGEALVVWTTTPWTLPANVAAAVDPELEYGRLASGDWVGGRVAAGCDLRGAGDGERARRPPLPRAAR